MPKPKQEVQNTLDKIVRRLDAIEKKFDIFDGDRQILENVVGRLTSLEEQSKLTRQKSLTTEKNIVEEVKNVGDVVTAKVETKLEEINDSIETKRLIPKKKSIWKLIFKR